MEIGSLSVRLAADTSPLKQGIDDAQSRIRLLDRFFEHSADNMLRTFTRIAGGNAVPTRSLGDSMLKLLSSMQNAIIGDYVGSLRQQAFGGARHGSGHASLAGVLGSALSGWIGGRAAGGAVGAGQTVMVGERGPELFTPFASGWVTPNAAGSAKSAPVSIVMHISTPDASSFRASQGQIMAEAALAMRKAGRYT